MENINSRLFQVWNKSENRTNQMGNPMKQEQRPLEIEKEESISQEKKKRIQAIIKRRNSDEKDAGSV
jgi:hypothetical protein